MPRCCRMRRMRWPRVSCRGTREAYGMYSRGLQLLALAASRRERPAQPAVLVHDVVCETEKGVAKRAGLRLRAAQLPAHDLQLLPRRPGTIAERHLDAVAVGPGFDRRRAAVGAAGALAPVADRDREHDTWFRLAMEVLEDVGAIDRDRVVVFIHHPDHAVERSAAMRARARRELVVGLGPQLTHRRLSEVVLRVETSGDAREVVEPVRRHH